MSLTAAVISDTHGLLRPSVCAYLRECDCIIHAGDFADEATLDWLSKYGALYAVRGNNDWNMASRLKPTLRFRLEQIEFILIHNENDLPNPLPDDVDVVICGHTHRWYKHVEDGVLWLNPGSCGRCIVSAQPTMALMKIDGKRYSVEKICLHDENGR